MGTFALVDSCELMPLFYLKMSTMDTFSTIIETSAQGSVKASCDVTWEGLASVTGEPATTLLKPMMYGHILNIIFKITGFFR